METTINKPENKSFAAKTLTKNVIFGVNKEKNSILKNFFGKKKRADGQEDEESEE